MLPAPEPVAPANRPVPPVTVHWSIPAGYTPAFSVAVCWHSTVSVSPFAAAQRFRQHVGDVRDAHDATGDDDVPRVSVHVPRWLAFPLPASVSVVGLVGVRVPEIEALRGTPGPGGRAQPELGSRSNPRRASPPRARAAAGSATSAPCGVGPRVVHDVLLCTRRCSEETMPGTPRHLRVTGGAEPASVRERADPARSGLHGRARGGEQAARARLVREQPALAVERRSRSRRARRRRGSRGGTG